MGRPHAYDGSVEGRAGNTETGGDFGGRDVDSFEQSTDSLDLFGREFGRETTLATASGCKPSNSSFSNQLAVELS